MTLSQLEILPPPLFLSIVRWLTLDDQCATLPMLSKGIKKELQFSSSVDFLSITVLDSKNVNAFPVLSIVSRKRTGRLPYLQYAHKMDITIATADLPEKRRRNILLSMKKSLVQGRLESLCINEVSFNTMFSELVNDLGGAKVRLRELYVQIDDAVMSRPLSSWGALKQCKSLRYVRIGMCATLSELRNQTKPSEVTLATLLASLPESVEELNFPMIVSDTDTSMMLLYKHLIDNTWLPMLRRFLVVSTTPDRQEFAPSSFISFIVQTIMQQTNKIRPIDTWSTRELNQTNDLKLLPLSSIQCGGISAEAAVELNRVPNTLWPDLSHVALKCADYGVNIPPLLKFISQRRIEQFYFLNPSDDRKESWSNDMITMMASLKHLQFMRLDTMYIPMFRPHDISKSLLVNSWPHLVHLELEVLDLTQFQLASLLAASPNLRYLACRSKSPHLTTVLMLALALHFCPSLVAIGLGSFGQSDTFQAAVDAFTRYPTPSNGGQNLIALSMIHLTGDARMFHYLCRRLRCARNLAYAHLHEASTSPLQLYFTRSLPGLRSLHQVWSGTGKLDKLITNLASPLLNEQIEFVIKPSVYGVYEDRTRFAEECHWVRHGETFDEIVSDAYETLVYPVFSRSIDEHGRDGRERFYDILYELLSDEDQTRVTTWDTEDRSMMSIKPNARIK